MREQEAAGWAAAQPEQPGEGGQGEGLGNRQHAQMFWALAFLGGDQLER